MSITDDEAAQPAPSVLSNKEETKLLSISWNQDHSCFSVGTNNGFHIYVSDPIRRVFRRDFPGRDFQMVEMLFRCNFYALVGGKANPGFPTNRVMLWDDQRGDCIGDIGLRTRVRGVRLRSDRIVVVLKQQVCVYNMVNLALVDRIETAENPKGLCCVSQEEDNFVLACPGLLPGQVLVKNHGLEVNKVICAHGSHLAQLALTLDGLVVATASRKGTLIRLFNSVDGTCFKEVRRGAERAEIHSIDLSRDVRWLLVSSDRGTIHVFSLRDQALTQDSSNRSNTTAYEISSLHDDQKSHSSVNGASPRQIISTCTTSSLSFMKGVLPRYFSSEWSFAKYYVPEGTQFLAAFGRDNSVLVVGMDGSFHKCSFDPVNGGMMTRLDYRKDLLKDGNS